MILYHGTTDEDTYVKIMTEGVRVNSWWTPDLRVAITMGGPYVIGAFFKNITELDPESFQIQISRKVPSRQFIVTMKVDVTLLSYSLEADRWMRKFRLEKNGAKLCQHCDGQGETTYLNDGHWWEVGGCRFDDRVNKKPSRSGPITTCLKCKGYGVI